MGSIRSVKSTKRSSDAHSYHNIAVPKKISKTQKFKQFIYDKEEHKCCYRTKRNWGYMIFYYTIYIFLIVLVFIIMFHAITRSMDKYDDRAYISKEYEFSVPTITLQPVRVNAKRPEPIIWYTHEGGDSYENRRPSAYISAITDWFKKLESKCIRLRLINCTFKRESLGPCGNGSYGYDEDKPCIYITMNIQRGWKPSAYMKLPSDIPSQMQKVINPFIPGVWAFCEGATKYDREHLGKIEYYPSQQFDDKYFPFEDVGDSVNPVVAIQINKLDTGYVLQLGCRIFTESRDPMQGNTIVWIYVI